MTHTCVDRPNLPCDACDQSADRSKAVEALTIETALRVYRSPYLEEIVGIIRKAFSKLEAL